MMAEAKLNKPEEAMEIYIKINPIEHSKSKEAVMKYKVEPYVLEGDIYSEGSLTGRGGWTWYTGSSSWLYEAQISYILGIKIYHGLMTIKPSVPKTWDRFNVKMRWQNAVYQINYTQIGEYKILTDSDLQINNNNEILLKTYGEYNIKVFF